MGKLIVFEGIDGSGKSTQLALLRDYLEKKGRTLATFKFPRYGVGAFGKLVDSYLKGCFGDPTKLNAYLSSVLFSADRQAAKDELWGALGSKEWVLVDRYTLSNVCHQAVKIKEGKARKDFERWVTKLEYKTMGIPEPSVVLYFRMPFAAATKFLEGDGRKSKDGHEKNKKYMLAVRKAYEAIAKKQKGWQIIECGQEGKIKSREEIAKEVRKVLGV